MSRFFNITGPCVPGKHFMLPPQDRVGDLRRLIKREEYFVVHAPRQSGRTTLLRALADQVNSEGAQVALYVTLERAEGLRSREEAVPAVIERIRDAAEANGLLTPDESEISRSMEQGASGALQTFMGRWCSRLPKPLVLLFDEVDALVDDALISFLRQLRDGYVNRPTTPFPSSIALVGMRNVRDLLARMGEHRYAIELKSVRPGQGLKRTEANGLEQLSHYLDILGLAVGYLLVFDQRPGRSWDERIYEKAAVHDGKRIIVFGA